MFRSSIFAATAAIVFSGAAPALAQTDTSTVDSATPSSTSNADAGAVAGASVETVVVTAKKLNEARAGIQTQIGASTYTVTAQAIQNQPGGDNQLLNSVILQMPSVAQDSFGQFHVRGEHNALQYRLNGVVLPEGISVFGQTLDPRLAQSVELITGALPAEYGLATGGIIDIRTKTGLFNSGGTLSLYGGSRSEYTPSFDYGGSNGSLNYFVAGDYFSNLVGIESPDGSATPIHDRTKQYHGFAYLEYVLDDQSSLTLIAGTSNDMFQIPNNPGQVPSLGLTVNGQTDFDSAELNENQRERTNYATLSYLRSQGPLDFQISLFGRFSSLYFTPDPIGDILFNGVAQTAYKRDNAYGVQAEGAYHLGSSNTIRAGIIVEGDQLTSRTSSDVLPQSCSGAGTPTDPYLCNPLPSTDPTFDVPITIIDNGQRSAWTYSFYIQDEWKLLHNLTVNYGLRYDTYAAYSSGSQLSPRINAVWLPLEDTTVHVGYARYFSPPPFELVASPTIAKFQNTSGILTPAILQDTTPIAERADYYDAGIQQQFGADLRVGLDSYYKLSKDMIDEGQFGAPIILTPFNYAHGRQYGAELTADYTDDKFSAYANFSLEHAVGKDWITSQFNFTPADFLYTQNNYIHLDHEQYASGSVGVSYKWDLTTFSADAIYGTGLREALLLPGGGDIPNGAHVPPYGQVNGGIMQDFSLFGRDGYTARFDVINIFNVKYQIRSGTGIGVFAPQYGPRRGFFGGLSIPL